MRQRGWRIFPTLAATFALAAGCMDATHDDQVQALGGESPGVPKGPTHRPGQPCLVCHGGEGPASTRFSVAGTVFAVLKANGPAVGARVFIEDVTGSTMSSTTNSVGNFYVGDLWQPTYPLQVQVSLGAASNQMLTLVGRDGSCASCHVDPSGPASPGPIYVAADPSAFASDGGTTR